MERMLRDCAWHEVKEALCMVRSEGSMDGRGTGKAKVGGDEKSHGRRV